MSFGFIQTEFSTAMLDRALLTNTCSIVRNRTGTTTDDWGNEIEVTTGNIESGVACVTYAPRGLETVRTEGSLAVNIKMIQFGRGTTLTPADKVIVDGATWNVDSVMDGVRTRAQLSRTHGTV